MFFRTSSLKAINELFTAKANLIPKFKTNMTALNLPKINTVNTSTFKLTSDMSRSAIGQIRFNSHRKIDDVLTLKTPRFDFDQIGGMQSVIHSFADIIDYALEPSKFKKQSLVPPKNLLLYGPPGNGKSIFPEALAGHIGWKYYLLSGSDLLGEYIGEGERMIKEIFTKANKQAPCILCIDEIDSVAITRFSNVKSGGELHHNTITNQLLAQLTQANEGVIIIATTNKHPDQLDVALVRAGRFDRHVYVPYPNAEDRKAIFAIHTKSKKLSANFDLDTLIKLTADYSSAKIVTLINEAGLNAKRRQANEITFDDFDQAIAQLDLGVLSNVIMTPSMRKRIATHEAGHALIGHLLGKQVYKVTLNGRGSSGGYTQFVNEDEMLQTKQQKLDDICVLLGGRASETICESVQFGSQDDLNKAKEIASKMIADEGMGMHLSGYDHHENVEIILQKQMQRAVRMLTKEDDKLHKIISALLLYQELRTSDFEMALADIPLNIKPYLLGAQKHTLYSLPVSVRYIPSIEAIAKCFRIDVKYLIKISRDDRCITIKLDRNLSAEKLNDLKYQLKRENIDHYIFSRENEFSIKYFDASLLKYIKPFEQGSMVSIRRGFG